MRAKSIWNGSARSVRSTKRGCSTNPSETRQTPGSIAGRSTGASASSGPANSSRRCCGFATPIPEGARGARP